MTIKRSNIEIVDFGEGDYTDDNDDTKKSYCMHCLSFGFKVSLKNRIYPEGEPPIAVSVIYTILFSASKQVGAFLFGLSFLIASAVVPNDSVKKSLLISCIGMVILFSSVEIRPLQYRVLPPYGLVTEAFIPLGAFMLLVGIFTSAVNVSQDGELRRVPQKCNCTIESIKDNWNRTNGKRTCKKFQIDRKTVS